MLKLHGSSSTFREIFRSQQATQIYIDAFKQFVNRLKLSDKVKSDGVNQRTAQILDKLSTLGLQIALDNAVSGPQKREVSTSDCCPVERVLIALSCSIRRAKPTWYYIQQTPYRQSTPPWLSIPDLSASDSHLLDSVCKSESGPSSRQWQGCRSGGRRSKFRRRRGCAKPFWICELPWLVVFNVESN